MDRILLRPPEHVVDAGFVRRALLERPVGPAGEPAAANSWSYPDYRTLKSHGGLEVAGYTAWEERTLGS
ncbi:MAG: hypothetical protein GWN71_35755, partial [Gammaproteobacteria bacterium]|nr:hypothetical protein [Gemmatimonadota bacterium]NIU78718.1 hypothetical protein [Gammaproteobacteria bacterium]NIX38082.1 hypothetical protein [Gemmatimonadota bacterium]